MSAPIKTIVDTGSICSALALTTGWLQAVVALVTIVWIGIRVFESRTVGGAIIRARCKSATRECPRVCRPEFGCEHYPQKTIPIREV